MTKRERITRAEDKLGTPLVKFLMHTKQQGLTWNELSRRIYRQTGIRVFGTELIDIYIEQG